jgi:hypothetical protein
MKFIITENKLNNVALSWMNKNFSPDQLEIVTYKKYPDSVFFKKDGVVVMEQDKKFKYFYFDYDDIWLFFESFFGMKYEQIEEVLSYWLKDTFKLEGYILSDVISPLNERLENTFKLK